MNALSINAKSPSPTSPVHKALPASPSAENKNAEAAITLPLNENLKPLKEDTLRIHTSKTGLHKENSFLNDNLKLVSKADAPPTVVATGPIEKGEIVCIFVGDVITKKELDKLPKDVQCESLQLAPEIYQIASKNPKNREAFDAAEYFGHSSTPNTFLMGNNVLVAGKDIKKGEEVTYDYGTSDTAGNPDTTSKLDAYKTIIPKLAEEYGVQGALDRVAQYIAEKWKQENKAS